jgi:hypothetical protein
MTRTDTSNGASPDPLASAANGSPDGTAVASAQVHNASARLANRRAPARDEDQAPGAHDAALLLREAMRKSQPAPRRWGPAPALRDGRTQDHPPVKQRRCSKPGGGLARPVRICPQNSVNGVRRGEWPVMPLRDRVLDTPDRDRPRLLTLAHAASLVNVSEKTIRRWIAGDMVPHVRLPLGGRRIPQGALLASLHRTHDLPPSSRSWTHGTRGSRTT